ncbi:hypothetical protein [Maricaulis sp.]|jgi:hypothetical protein|uniref:hypothetical protein n=1 Tax=Maricaulis sp. TaxID=1486257 RepID=UPI00260E0A15|nr:hypothetical protein [Maricaulis sp.]
MAGPVIERFAALDSAYREHTGRGERLYARFSALAGLSCDAAPDALASHALAIRDALNDGLGMWRAPARSMRLVFGAALAAADRTAAHFFEAREALARQRKARGGRRLTHGGACAALGLVAGGGQAHHADTFYDILETIAAPWWRRDAAREEVVAAIFAAMGETPEDALTHLEKARTALLTAGVPRADAEAAACEIAFYDYDATAIAPAWTTLNTALRNHNKLRHGVGKTGLAVLAAQGNNPSTAKALIGNFDAVRSLEPRPPANVAAKLALRLTQAQIGDTAPIAAARDLAAILAAQAAMIAAVTAASSAAAVAATS